MKKTKKSTKVLNLIVIFAFVLVFIFYCLLPNLAGKDLDVNITCKNSPVNGPSAVSIIHPNVTIVTKPGVQDLWITITASDGQENIISFTDVSSIDPISLPGWVSDIRGAGNMIFIPGDYTVRGYSHPSDTRPTFTVDEILFESSFTVPNCN